MATLSPVCGAGGALFWKDFYVLGQNLLFDPRPKTRRADLFGRDRELEMLAENVNSPLILITGIRRIGKIINPERFSERGRGAKRLARLKEPKKSTMVLETSTMCCRGPSPRT
jgi:hypothetical protein